MAARRPFHTDGAPSLSSTGIVFICVAALWTLLLIAGFVKLAAIRNYQSVRIRGFWLIIVQVVAIDIYLTAIFVVYPLNGAYTCMSEYWMMSLIFPGGLALFQVGLVRLLAVYENQVNMYNAAVPAPVKPKTFPFMAIAPRNHKLYVHYTWISIAFLAQIIVSSVIFAGSRRFGASNSWFGDLVGEAECRRGWEWLPSVLWQFAFTWIYAPWLLYKTSHIHDIHKFRLQTTLCAIAGLFGTPLWLAFLYGPEAKVHIINGYWPPACWFIPSLMTMQATTLFIPILTADNSETLHRTTASLASVYASLIKKKPDTRFAAVRATLKVNRAALEYQLEKHPGDTPFARFMAMHALAYEIVLFVRSIPIFKSLWTRGTTERERFETAVRIFFVYLEPATSISGGMNVPSAMLKKLRQFFVGVKYTPAAPVKDSIAPWDDEDILQDNPPQYTSEPGSPSIGTGTHIAPKMPPGYERFDMRHHGTFVMTSVTEEDFEASIPDDFGNHIFDAMREHVVDMLFHDVWRRYIEDVSDEELVQWPLRAFVNVNVNAHSDADAGTV